MNELRILDVTLRDGGCVNDFNFGQVYMEKILSAQEQSGIDIIEIGYIDEKNGAESGRTKFVNESVIAENLLKAKKKGLSYVAMIDFGKYDIGKLSPRNENGIDGIRIAFHKENRADIIAIGKRIIAKGYDLYLQPMITLRYSDSELLDLISVVNNELSEAKAFYIVDSFGEMRPNDMSRILNLVDHNLDPKVTIGFHSHNNLQLSYSNALAMLQFPTKRNIIIDCSIMGMGKGAGNLNTELLMEHLNLFYGKNYYVPPLLEVIDKVINQLHNEYYWGYAPEYYLSSANHCTPSYASHYYNKHMLPIDHVGELLGMLDEEKRVSFDKDYAEELYRKYNDSKAVDDTETVKEIRSQLFARNVCLIAPGKSMIRYLDYVKKTIRKEDAIVICLNNVLVEEFDYIVTTRMDIYKEAVSQRYNVIAPSNISKGGRGNIRIINYRNWIDIDTETQDSSTVMTLNLLQSCGIKKLYLAGFDGYSLDINENYADPTMRIPLNAEQAEERNNYYRRFIKKMRDLGTDITFLTPSKYNSDINDI